jgi:hypothetical protein
MAAKVVRLTIHPASGDGCEKGDLVREESDLRRQPQGKRNGDRQEIGVAQNFPHIPDRPLPAPHGRDAERRRGDA